MSGPVEGGEQRMWRSSSSSSNSKQSVGIGIGIGLGMSLGVGEAPIMSGGKERMMGWCRECK